ncbi:integrase [Pandoraea sputorum]|uniref:Integrase n=1 Tax=Pandoraea sputorum TaxID=93222 RepID=A0A5E5BK45_9BURK|nr:integrase [Pandoraea sputorum]
MLELGEVMTILELHRQGLSISAIAARLEMDRKTVCRLRDTVHVSPGHVSWIRSWLTSPNVFGHFPN